MRDDPQDQEDFTVCGENSQLSTAVVSHSIAGQTYNLTDYVSISAPEGVPNNLGVHIDGRSVTATLNGTPIIQAQDVEPFSFGKVGVAAQATDMNGPVIIFTYFQLDVTQ